MPPLPVKPSHPERICWGCTKYCQADDLACGNGTIRAPHPIELFGDDWLDWIENRGTVAPADDPADLRGSGSDPALSARRT
jgi:hypothetical protein